MQAHGPELLSFDDLEQEGARARAASLGVREERCRSGMGKVRARERGWGFLSERVLGSRWSLCTDGDGETTGARLGGKGGVLGVSREEME